MNLKFQSQPLNMRKQNEQFVLSFDLGLIDIIIH
jgi:hypothetical protein